MVKIKKRGSSQRSRSSLLSARGDEIQHRVTAALRDHVFGGERMPLSAVLEMLDSRAGQFDVDEAILRAERFSSSPIPE
jgi:hypothetical protein